MKKIIFALAILSFATFSQAQTFKYGLKLGIGSASLRPENASFSNTDSIRLGISNAKYGYYFGAFGQLKLGKITLQPEVLFNSNRVDYSFKNIKTPSLDSIRTERYNNLDLPILLGFKLGPIKAKVGPVAHIHVNSKSELSDVKGYSEKWNAALWGYQAGIGLNFGEKVHIDIRYEGNFDKWGSHINIGGKNFQFQQAAPSRFLVNLGYALN